MRRSNRLATIQLDVFQQGQDVFIDYPYEDAMFRYEHRTGRVFRKFYGQPEVEIDRSSTLFHEAISGGQQITARRYEQGE